MGRPRVRSLASWKPGSGHDAVWTNQLRQQLAYAKDADDGTFWISYADFATHFTAAFATRVADDQWTKLSVKSRWMDVTAGGGPSSISWRDNYQWRLALPRETEVTFQLSLPDPRLGGPSVAPPMGLLITRSNPAPDGRRRRLRLRDPPAEIVYEIEPRASRRLQVTTRLPPSPLT